MTADLPGTPALALRDRIAAAMPGLDAVMAIVDDALWMARNTSSGGRCRWCGAKTPRPGPAHRMHCKNYLGPLTHTWVRTGPNETFGGIDYWCSCGGWFRQGGSAGHGDGSATATAVCPNAGQAERETTDAE